MRPSKALPAVLLAAAAWLAPAAAPGEEKLVLLDDVPRTLGPFEVAGDGGRLFFGSGSSYYVFDAAGRLVDKYGLSSGSARELIPLPDGWFIAMNSHAGGHVALFRPDGTPERKLVVRGGNDKTLRGDMTGWTSPTGGAVDAGRKLIFAVDTSMAPRDVPDPVWSRVAVFDFDGQYVGDINRHDGKAADPNDRRRTWYDDIEVDPARRRVYVTARRTRELLAFDYDGKPAGKAPGQRGIAVLPDGRVAVVAADDKGVQLYDADLKPLGALPARGVVDLEADAAGRLYASTNDPSVTFIRWPADLGASETFGPRYCRIGAEFPPTAATAGQTMSVRVRVEGRPAPAGADRWHAMVRPSNGSDLRWRPLEAAVAGDLLKIAIPPDLRGPCELVVRFGDEPIGLADRKDELLLQKTYAFVPPGAARSVAVIPATGRRAYRRGEAIDLHVVRRDAQDAHTAVEVKVTLAGEAGPVGSAAFAVRGNLACRVPASLTRHLPPGRYVVRPEAAGHESYALTIDLAAAEADSPLQRILYHEFDNEAATMRQNALADAPERLAFIRDYAGAVRRLGFTRETDRFARTVNARTGPSAWRRDSAPADLKAPGYAPPEHYAFPPWNAQWEAEQYLDEAVRRGLCYDSQLLGHCSGVRFRDYWLRDLVPILLRTAQWLGRFPSFYGFNYNDEMFFGGFASEWVQADKDWLQKVEAEKFAGRPRADVYMYALRVMYGAFHRAVRQVNPRLARTATPMWQFPAADGSYPPVVYEDMTESYSHFLSEGYHFPWYPAHSVDILRRPGLPLMGVFDNSYGYHGGDGYLQDLMQVLGRGVQGAGVQHHRPFKDPLGASAYRTGNLLAAMYGPVFAECRPANEGEILYSYTQDITEHRNNMGTPHWERAFALHSAGLMAGVPMGITFEEDVAAGGLLDGGRPRVGMLFLVGQSRPLPEKVRRAIDAFVAAGGKVFTDADSAVLPGATRLDLHTHELKPLFHEGYAADTVYPLFQPVLEKLAAGLVSAVAGHRRFGVDSDTPWVSKNVLDGGAIRYVMLATDEGAPYPWDAGAVWSLRALWRYSCLPRTTTMTFPLRGGAVYDVFERRLVQPEVAGGKAKLTVDLRTFPARLYAVAPAELGPPRLAAGVGADETLRYEARAVDAAGKPIRARVPLRVRVLAGERVVLDVYRGTGADGSLAGSTPWPLQAEACTLEVAELLGGRASRAEISHRFAGGAVLVRRDDVAAQREAQIRALLDEARVRKSLTAFAPKAGGLTDAHRAKLTAAFRRQGVELSFAEGPPKEPAEGVYLAAGHMPGDATLGELLAKAHQHGLFDWALSGNVPGPGRGLFTALFAPRGMGEHCIGLVGGDAEGLGRTVDALAAWLDAPGEAAARPAPAPPAPAPVGAPAEAPLPPRLADMVGARLDGVRPAGDGRHLLVTARGYLRNVALIEDAGGHARLVRAARVGQAPSVHSPFVARGGRLFGAAGRTVASFGQGLHVVDAASGGREVFAAFGDIGRAQNHFAISDDGATVLAGGTYGVVCWRRDAPAGTWREAWAVDYWKEFARLDWPVSPTAERIPQFHAFLPHASDTAMILFGEFTNQGWVTPDNACKAHLAAVDLATGQERWRFDVPIFKSLLLPTLHASDDGSQILVQVQVGSWNKETFSFFRVAGGKELGSWSSRVAPLSVALAESGGRVALAFAERLLEVRDGRGRLLYNLFWRNQPVGVAFAADGVRLYVADDAGGLTLLDDRGGEVWRVDLPCVSTIAAAGDGVYAAGWDGRLRSFTAAGRARWTLDCTPALNEANPMRAVAGSARYDPGAVIQARRPSTADHDVPDGENLLRSGKATLTVGGTKSWMSDGKVLVSAEQLTNGRTDDVTGPWLHLDEVFWTATAGRQVWAEIAFAQPTDVRALTVHENPAFADSWPSEALVQVWDERLKRWNTAAFGVFLRGAVHTYRLDLKAAAKIRYVPWNSYYRNFHTSEIEVR